MNDDQKRIEALELLCAAYRERINNLEHLLDALNTAYDNTVIASMGEIPQVKRYWKGSPPAECVGRCDIQGFLYGMCAVCKWSEEYFPPSNSEY